TDRLPVGPNPAGAIGTPDSPSFVKKPDLGDCDSLRVPDHAKLVLHAFGSGVQIYTWSGAAWTFVAPPATLFSDEKHPEIIGTHFAGPTWESTSGSTVVGAVVKRCPADPSSIPWLLLQAVSNGGDGVFDDVDFIQRLNTVGGNAPSAPG